MKRNHPRHDIYPLIISLSVVLAVVSGCSFHSSSNISFYKAPPFDLSVSYRLHRELSPYERRYFQRTPTAPLLRPKIVINKALRRLYLFDGNELVKVYPINMGPNALQDKLRQGDNGTPEGVFYICMKKPNSKYHMSLGISYPNIEDAERGLRQGLITEDQYRAIITAIQKRERPPWFTKLGGAICIHGGGIGRDWTEGCIALRNKDIEEIYSLVPKGAPVVIRAGLARERNLFETRESYLTRLKNNLANEPKPMYRDPLK